MEERLIIDFDEFSDGVIDNTLPDQPAWVGEGIFDKLMHAINGNIEVQYKTGRLNGENYADVYLGSMQTAIVEAMKFVLAKRSIEKDLENKDLETAMSERALAEADEKWAIQRKILENQLDMSNVDVEYKPQNAQKDIELKDKQIETASADIEFNISKKTIMEQTRNDNIRSKAAEQFGEFLKYISAANVVPGENDFKNMRALINAMNDGIANPGIVANITTVGADFVKP